jgi:enoyl-CoA hydratase/carnithine racemase
VVVVEDRDDGVTLLTLNRPRQRNSLISQSWDELAAALERVAREERARAVVLTGGSGFFSSGGDLKSTPALGRGAFAPAGRLQLAQSVLSRLRALAVPVIAAVEGGAVGLGWSLVLSCDLVVAAENAFFAAPFVARGVVPDGGAAWYLVERLGRHRASELLLTDARLDAARAEQLGLVNILCAPGKAGQRAMEVAAGIVAADPGAVELTKRLLGRAEGISLEQYLPLELATGVVAQQRSGAQAGRRGFG